MTYLLLLHCFAYDESEDQMTELKTITRKSRHGVKQRKRLRKKYVARNEQWRVIQGELRNKRKPVYLKGKLIKCISSLVCKANITRWQTSHTAGNATCKYSKWGLWDKPPSDNTTATLPPTPRVLVLEINFFPTLSPYWCIICFMSLKLIRGFWCSLHTV